ncbi:hypothetical protein [Gordonia sihwensis]|uniref:hypothetical protein n=1 Tax=Gordonia TaxID=2053 RepID=UPI002416F600|nr:hypothetical protein [Gordonia sihwensis]WFN94108.1 hypothetical protein P5P27_06055 [Gordonia sihwensis]
MFNRRDRVAEGDISTVALRKLVQKLDARQPLTDEYEARTAAAGRNSNGNQKAHLDGWLGEYGSPGYYGRKSPSNSGKAFYNHFRCAPGLMWLAEGLGEDPVVLRQAIARVDGAFGNPSSEAAAFRAVVPWSRIVELVEASKSR